MKLYTYGPALGLETIEARESSDSRYVAIAHGIIDELVRRADLDTDGPYYTRPERALQGFIRRGEARLVAPVVARKLTRLELREWRAAIKVAREKLEFLGGRQP